MKLTEPQKRVLLSCTRGIYRCSKHYKPAAKIVELGLATWGNGLHSAFLFPTESGRELAKQLEGGSDATLPS